ncbi:MAG: alpha/beta hydrolase [Lachnospiraceae bacterium]|nr:alpha/beta hydrolase [Lachnospiraceae bacterium]
MYISLKKPDGIKSVKLKITCGNNRIPLLVLSPESGAKDAPGVLWIHGGGYITGMKEMVYMSRAVDLVKKFGAIVVSVGYRLAITNPYPAALDDCYAALLWMKEHARELNIRTDQLMVGGESAGGGLCAAVCMKARDSGDVKIAFQMPLYPMIDNFDTDSSADNHGRIWNTRRNHFGWKMYLRKSAKRKVSPYAAPAGQNDYSNLPPCYTFVGDGEPFYAETIAYTDNLKAAGVEAECDVYPTNIHAFDMLYPGLDASKAAIAGFNEHFRHAAEHYFAG